MTQLLRRIYHSLPAPPSTNYNLNQIGLGPYALLAENSIVLDVGSGETGVDKVWHCKNLQFINLDIEYTSGVTLVGDAHQIPLKSNSVDCVTCISVLEYVKNPQQVVAELHRVLRPGGLLYLSVPFVFPYHPPPEDLYRFSMHGMRVLTAGFAEIQVGSNRGPASTFCHLLVHFLAILLCFNSKRFYGILLDFFKWTLFWVKYLDMWIGNYSVAKFMYGNAFFFGKKL
jgi:SAM-dependent methyltransferase